MPDTRRLPEGFLWGASTAAHQIEGGNTNSDWWEFEHSQNPIVKEPSGDACDSYHRWREDMDLLAELGFTDYRFSIEWARIEPSPGEFSRSAIAHYRRMVEGARERGLRPMVTLHHFTNPLWFAQRGGWAAAGSDELFARFLTAAAPIYATDVAHVCTINEPNIVTVMAAAQTALASGQAVSFTENPPAPDEATTDALVRAHARAVETVKSLAPHVHTGWSIANLVCQPLPGSEDVADSFRHPRQDVFIEAARGDDWLGVQAYTRTLIGPQGRLPVPQDAERTLMGWEYYPQALGHALRHSASVSGGTPLIVTENGIATADDARRIDYTTGALDSLATTMREGIDVRGYFHWSALDNYEWGRYAPTFGLIAVDRETFARAPKPSAAWLGAIGRTRVLPTEY
ncbi:glycoside hydrolase family 1 protein [Streptomyces sp. NBC_00388]|uniref:glycoside hydrolase family 1 protein n=1 Tax=Streptomyces sp. NBC_00388 TaxID=2975735 RepID=UPI002E229507